MFYLFTLDISAREILKLLFDKVLIVQEICASAKDNASRFIVLETAKADEDNISIGMTDILILLDNTLYQ